MGNMKLFTYKTIWYVLYSSVEEYVCPIIVSQLKKSPAHIMDRRLKQQGFWSECIRFKFSKSKILGFFADWLFLWAGYFVFHPYLKTTSHHVIPFVALTAILLLVCTICL